MSAAATLLVALASFAGGAAAVAAVYRWLGRSRRAHLGPNLERLLRSAIRFERLASKWSPAWRPVLSDEDRQRAHDLIDDLEEDARVALVAMTREGAAAVAGSLRELKAHVSRFQSAIALAPAGGEAADLGAAAAAIAAFLPELETVVLAEPVRRLPAIARSAPATPATRTGWLASLEPLRHTAFRWLWLASVASQLGIWIQNVGAVDQMTILAPTALLLALVQTATSLPGLLLALPAGALADIVDRRRLLVMTSAWMCGVSLLLGVTALLNVTSSWLLLGLTFALGAGTVAGLPAWQAIIPDLVPRAQLAQAVTLSSVAINVARVSGPAIGGVAVALAGPSAAFALTGLSFAATTLVVLQWRRGDRPATLPAEGMIAAIRFGVRYSLLNAPVRSTLVRAAGFILFASVLWALMPVVSRRFDAGFAGYSGLLASLGVGALTSALLLTRVRRVLEPDALVVAATLLFAAISVAVALSPRYLIALVLMPGAGIAWVCGLSTFNVSAQLAAPAWVRGRVLASYQVTQMGTLAIGSALWGAVATHLGLLPAMSAAALLLAASSALAIHWRLNGSGREVIDVDTIAGALPALAHVASLRARSLRRDGAGDLSGRQLGPYQLEAPIGAGGAGCVYLARHMALDAPRAIKVMWAELARNAALRDGFLRGARTAARLRHPNIVSVCDCGVDHGVPYLVMDYVDSLTLEERLQSLPVPHRAADPTVRRCVLDVAAALDHARAAGVVHGGVRPGNVLVRTRDGRALLNDFSLVTARPADAYLAPEQRAAGMGPSAGGDVYAFTALLYEVATGGPPSGRVLAAVAGRPDRPLPPVTLSWPHLPPALDTVLARGLATSPDARYRTAGEVARAYLAATERTLPALTPASFAAARSPARASRLWPAATALLGTVALFGATVALQAVPPVGLPRPVTGAVGKPMTVDTLRLTVLAVQNVPAGRLVNVQVQYQGDPAGSAVVSPYDWVITDASGAVYQGVEVGGGLQEHVLAPAQTARGSIEFAVPSDARGLVLHYDAEQGDQSAQVPLG